MPQYMISRGILLFSSEREREGGGEETQRERARDERTDRQKDIRK